ncbi:MAG: 50S ribosomal protein L17 [Spirochaetia bacterium]|nr:50S ribosomal protein L17 [Spirochaetia bacterium]
MRKQNKVKQLQRTSSHRKAMLNNIVTSLIYHEQIKSTTAKVKAARSQAEKLITRAKKNLNEEADDAVKVGNIRLVSKVIKQKEILHKLFNDVAHRYKDRNGGYTRIIKLGKRDSDKSEMALLELVEKKDLVELKEERKAIRESRKSPKKKPEKKAEDKTSAKKTEKKKD